MTSEEQLADFACTLQADHVPESAAVIVRQVLLTTGGTAVAGAGEDGIAPLRKLLYDRGGKPQATSLVYGDRLPAGSAAFINGVMCRALDYCDAMLPGLHIGSSLIPAAFAAAELAGGCSGREFLAALAAGAELASRFNLSEAQYDGYDPTGVAGVFASTAAAARLLHLTPRETLHALALAFNRCGGSFQSNVDGSLAVRVIQGWVAETGITCAQLAQAGITGPTNFVSGVYGFCHLYGRDQVSPASITAGLGSDWRLKAMVFKKYPSCGGTQGMTEIALDMVRTRGIAPENLRSMTVRVRPYTFKLVGHPFKLGDSPRVDAQFSAQYCVASAIVRRAATLSHFRVDAVHDAAVHALVDRIKIVSDDRLAGPGQPCAVLSAALMDGAVHEQSLAFAPGFPGNELRDADHVARFEDCMQYAPYPLKPGQVTQFLDGAKHLPSLPDVRSLLACLRSDAAPAKAD